MAAEPRVWWLVLAAIGWVTVVDAVVNETQRGESFLQLLVMEPRAQMCSPQGLRRTRRGHLVLGLLGSSCIRRLLVLLAILGPDFSHLLGRTGKARLLMLSAIFGPDFSHLQLLALRACWTNAGAAPGLQPFALASAACGASPHEEHRNQHPKRFNAPKISAAPTKNTLTFRLVIGSRENSSPISIVFHVAQITSCKSPCSVSAWPWVLLCF